MTKPRTYPQTDDDPAFLALVDRVIDTLIRDHEPAELFVVRIKNWFDYKWLRFSGMGMVPFDSGHPQPEAALGEFRRKELTFPPFTPSRVLAQHYFRLTTKKDYEEQSPPYLVHKTEKDHSSANIRRHVKEFSDSAAYLWYSSNSAANLQGCVMVYLAGPKGTESWYASLQKKKETWKINQTKGINKDSLTKRIDA
ncbi:MAG: hypothetical protein ACYS8Z_22390 [Planctomycetota bacterium]|jgi:hypothetical protein